MSKSNINETDNNINNIDNKLMNKINKDIVNPKIKNLDIYLMEKDKEIIDLISLNKSLISQIEDLKRANKDKEIQITSLKTDVNTLETDKKLITKENEKLNEDIKNLNNLLHIRDNQINEIMKKNDENIKEINNAYNVQIKNYEETLKNSQNIQINNNSLTEKMLLKDKEIINMQKIIYDLKQDNKKIFNLEKEIEEKNLNIYQLKEYIKKLEKENFIHGNSDLIINNNQLNDNTKYNFDYSRNTKDNQNIFNTNINNNKDNKEYNDYNNYVTNNLISFIIEQIKKVELSIDNKNILNINNNIYTNDILNEENSTYELIKQNFNLLINKIKFMHEDNFKKKSEILKMIDIEKNKNMQLSSNIKVIDQKSKNEILSMRQALEMKTTEIQQLKDKLNLVISNQNNNDDNLSNIFEQHYNEIFSKLKNFTEFYCKNINTERGQIILQMPNFSLSDPIDKKINDIFYTIKNVINYIENNMKNNRGNNIRNNFDNYMKEINDLNNKIKRLSELFKKNENLLKQITDENRELKQKNIQLQNIINSMKRSPQINNKKINDNKNNLNNNNINNNDNLWKVSNGYHYNTVSPNNNNFNTENNKKNMLELKDLISLHQTKNDNLMNEFYNKDQQITSLENEANKLIKENYVGNNINIFNNKNNKNNKNNFNNNNNNQIYTFKNENEDEQYEQEENNEDEEEEIVDHIYNSMNNNDEVNDEPQYNNENIEDNEIYEENYDNNNNDYSNEEENYLNEEQINDNDNDNDNDENNY